jgi:hypothetical protein
MAADPHHLQPSSKVDVEAEVPFANHPYFVPTQPRVDIDVFLEPLMEDMKILWETVFKCWMSTTKIHSG